VNIVPVVYLLASQLSFRLAFWATVAVNLGLLYLASGI
jgi:hypothetical protein